MIALTNTTSAEIARTIRSARRNQGMATGLVYTLLVICTARHYDEALEAALQAGREHPSRILLIVRKAGKRSKLDAEVRISESVPGDVVTLWLSGEVADHADSVVRPLVLPDTPVVAWWPNESPVEPGADPIGLLAHRRITDAGGVPNALEAMRVRAKHHAPGDTDLSWTRITPWRALLAAALDQYPARVVGASVEAARGNAAAELMASWLQSRLDVEVVVQNSAGPGITGIRLHTPAGDIAVLRSDGKLASYEVPGQPRRLVALKRRELPALISEELRRMDADDIFEAATATLLERAAKGVRRKRATSAKKPAAKARASQDPKAKPRSTPRRTSSKTKDG
ncbi:glucose-6-phosphate dehydrogenase assembly protein OpcA [Aestuariimicrobium ganziense]|uniref:glucose-6-phosphate dehydrogenase assembly protein OpcA n=1 Tax=Aestuariimicrobium ganziense TaxID=2773677 RepID=UPI00194078B1|nr:glucose-6-phosphate dehydrogenase assembly protein OpcA [Aestuariimicrobium ganziense]